MGLFNRSGDAEVSEERSVSLDGATSVRARIDMSVGELVITGGSADLMNGQFIFDTDLAPKISYDVRNGIGDLSVRQSRGGRMKKCNRNRWQIALHDDVPIDLEIHMATGKLEARLATLRLATVHIEHTTGETIVDLGGHQLSLAEVKIEQSTGRTHLDLNGNYAALQKLRLSATTGETTVSLAGGAWGQDLDARIDVTTGNAVIRLPRDVGVEVGVRTSLGSITTSGLHFDGSFYHNDAFGTDAATVRLDVRSSIGKIALEVAG
jgi:hypothetical protein